MKRISHLLVLFGMLVFFNACSTVQEWSDQTFGSRDTAPATSSTSGTIQTASYRPESTPVQNNYYRDEMERIHDRLQALETSLQRQQSEIQNLRQQITQLSQASSGTASNTQQIQQLQQQIQAIDAARLKDRDVILNEVANQIARINRRPQGSSNSSSSSKGQSRPSTDAVEEGYEHVVKPGETVSAIAAAYGVSVDDILKANNLTKKDATRVRVNQKLFIPKR